MRLEPENLFAVLILSRFIPASSTEKCMPITDRN